MEGSVSRTRSTRGASHEAVLTLLVVLLLSLTVAFSIYTFASGVSSTEGKLREGIKEVEIRAFQWGFQPSVVYVQPGDKVRFIVVSDDIMHGFAINELGINIALRTGVEARSPVVTVNLTQGTYTIYCSVFCGMGHPSMKARLVVGRPGVQATLLLPITATGIAAVASAVFLYRVRSSAKRGS